MPGVEFRYIEKANEKGVFSANYLDDKLSDPSETDYYDDTGFTHTNSDRYWLRGKADHIFGDYWYSRLDIDIVSDQDYLTEFKAGSTGFNSNQEKYLETFGRGFQTETDPLRKNTFKLLRSWDDGDIAFSGVGGPGMASIAGADQLLASIHGFRMPLFFMISGLTVSDGDRMQRKRPV